MKIEKILIFLVKCYQNFISPLFPPSCRFYPTCSNYMLVALKKHGPFLGLIMGIARILRCNPFNPGGIDHVPDYFTIFKNSEDKRNSIVNNNGK